MAKMKNNKFIYRLLVVFSLSASLVSCDDDDENKVSAGFAGIGSDYNEAQGDVTVTIPFINGSVSPSDIVFEGSATAGADYDVLGVTAEGIQIKFKQDDDYEHIEKLRVRIVNASGIGNKVHTITLFSDNCEDAEGMEVADLAAVYTVVTDDWADFDEGDHLTIEAVDETHVQIVEYPDTGTDHEPLVLTISNLSSGNIVVASQNNGSYTANGSATTFTSGSGIVSAPCTLELMLDFNVEGDDYEGFSLVLQREPFF